MGLPTVLPKRPEDDELALPEVVVARVVLSGQGVGREPGDGVPFAVELDAGLVGYGVGVQQVAFLEYGDEDEAVDEAQEFLVEVLVGPFALGQVVPQGLVARATAAVIRKMRLFLFS